MQHQIQCPEDSEARPPSHPTPIRNNKNKSVHIRLATIHEKQWDLKSNINDNEENHSLAKSHPLVRDRLS